MGVPDSSLSRSKTPPPPFFPPSAAERWVGSRALSFFFFRKGNRPSLHSVRYPLPPCSVCPPSSPFVPSGDLPPALEAPRPPVGLADGEAEDFQKKKHTRSRHT